MTTKRGLELLKKGSWPVLEVTTFFHRRDEISVDMIWPKQTLYITDRDCLKNSLPKRSRKICRCSALIAFQFTTKSNSGCYHALFWNNYLRGKSTFLFALRIKKGLGLLWKQDCELWFDFKKFSTGAKFTAAFSPCSVSVMTTGGCWSNIKKTSIPRIIPP